MANAAASVQRYDADLERFRIRSRPEIIALLREMLYSRVLVTIHFRSGESFIVTSLLACNPSTEELIFDCGADAAVTQALTRASRFTVSTVLRHVRVQFNGEQIESTRFEDAPALRTRVPTQMLRFQRRDFFRSAALARPPLVCRIPAPDGQIIEEVRILNISCGGIAILTGLKGNPIELGRLLERCTIDLQEVGQITADIQIRNLIETTLPSGAKQLRYGCEFKSLRGTDQTLIQRYIHILERSRLVRE